jgi:hypothetical protein
LWTRCGHSPRAVFPLELYRRLIMSCTFGFKDAGDGFAFRVLRAEEQRTRIKGELKRPQARGGAWRRRAAQNEVFVDVINALPDPRLTSHSSASLTL